MNSISKINTIQQEFVILKGDFNHDGMVDAVTVTLNKNSKDEFQYSVKYRDGANLISMECESPNYENSDDLTTDTAMLQAEESNEVQPNYKFWSVNFDSYFEDGEYDYMITIHASENLYDPNDVFVEGVDMVTMVSKDLGC